MPSRQENADGVDNELVIEVVLGVRPHGLEVAERVTQDLVGFAAH